MKHDIRSSPWVKGLALVLAVACGVGASLCAFYCWLFGRSLFQEGDYTQSAAYYRLLNQQYALLRDGLNLAMESDQRELTYLEQKDLADYEQSLSPDATNFRFVVRNNQTGEVVTSSGDSDHALDGVKDLYTALWPMPTFTYGTSTHDENSDTTYYFDEDGTLILIYRDIPDSEMEEETTSVRVDDHSVPVVNQLPDEMTVEYAVEYGVDSSLPVEDGFRQVRDAYAAGDDLYFYLGIALALAFLVLTVFLLCCAGRRAGAEGFVRNWQDKIPYDLYLCVCLGVLIVALAALFEWCRLYSSYVYENHLAVLWERYFLIFGLASAGILLLGEALVMTTATRCKTRTLFKNTLLWRLGSLLWKVCKRAAAQVKDILGNLDVTGRVLGGGFLYLLVNGLLAMGLFRSRSPEFSLLLLVLFNGAVLFLICRWTVQWKVVRRGTAAIVGGQPDTVIDTEKMNLLPALRQHAQQLNCLGSAINTAVEERMKSERMKAELITNVSHDLKTPLTSIINYVDLLKKEDIENETARGYIDVLDRKSQRLKKLTEDLVEASKASTGALAVTRERLGVVQLVDQALGEYSEKLEAAQLTTVVSLPEEEVYVSADGRHFWRILDNLMGNCVKYAMPGTRVYLDVRRWEGSVILSLKNISAQQLNIPAEQLMERFVRGDESRTTEGSGLGLSIARSLTELQGGTFRLEVDGDLFKAVVIFPEIK